MAILHIPRDCVSRFGFLRPWAELPQSFRLQLPVVLRQSNPNPAEPEPKKSASKPRKR